MLNEPSDPDQDTLDDFVDESTENDDAGIEVPDGVEENLPAGYSDGSGEDDQ